MTYQSSPMYPIIFPDEAARINPYGVRPLKGNTIVVEPLQPAGHEAHPSWKKQADKVVYDFLQNNRQSDLNLLRGPPSIKGSKYTTYRGDPSERNSYMARRGGVANTREGERMIGELVRDRIPQLNSIDTAQFEAVDPGRVGMKSPPQSEFYQLDSMYAFMLEALDAGDFRMVPSKVEGIINAMLAVGDRLTDNKLLQYSQAVKEAILIAEGYENEIVANGLESREKKFVAYVKLLKSTIKQLYALKDFIKKMSNIVNRSPAEKEMLLNQIRNTLLPFVMGSTTPADPYAQQRSEQEEYEASLGQA
jgi:hypothetical protein